MFKSNQTKKTRVIILKVYILAKKMSHKNLFLESNFTKNADFLRKSEKYKTLCPKFLRQAKKQIELKMPKLLKNHVQTQV